MLLIQSNWNDHSNVMKLYCGSWSWKYTVMWEWDMKQLWFKIIGIHYPFYYNGFSSQTLYFSLCHPVPTTVYPLTSHLFQDIHWHDIISVDIHSFIIPCILWNSINSGDMFTSFEIYCRRWIIYKKCHSMLLIKYFFA